MLNRIRDFAKREERVRPENHKDLEGAMYISCKNKTVEILNTKGLNEMREELVSFESLHSCYDECMLSASNNHEPIVQMTKMCSSDVDVLTVYRSSGGYKDELLKDILDRRS